MLEGAICRHRIKSRIFPLYPLLFVGCVLTSIAFAKSGPQIPTPAVAAEEAIALAHKELLASKKLIDIETIRPDEYMLLSVKFTKSKQNVWFWDVFYIHPKHTDHSVRLGVSMDRKVKVLEVSE